MKSSYDAADWSCFIIPRQGRRRVALMRVNYYGPYSVWQLASTSLPRVMPGIAAFATIQVYRELESTCFR